MPEKTREPGIRLALSGGGFRATLFHIGSLWRLNELGYLPKLTIITSVSSRSITSGVLAHRWKQLRFDNGSIARNFTDAIVIPLRGFCSQPITDFQDASQGVKWAYWGITTNIDHYGLTHAITKHSPVNAALQNVRTRLNAFSEEEQCRLINWGYALADTALRKHVLAPDPSDVLAKKLGRDRTVQLTALSTAAEQLAGAQQASLKAVGAAGGRFRVASTRSIWHEGFHPRTRKAFDTLKGLSASKCYLKPRDLVEAEDLFPRVRFLYSARRVTRSSSKMILGLAALTPMNSSSGRRRSPGFDVKSG